MKKLEVTFLLVIWTAAFSKCLISCKSSKAFSCDQNDVILKRRVNTWIERAQNTVLNNNCSGPPIDINNPILDIKLNMLRGRLAMLQKLMVTIESSNGEILFHGGIMKNGHLLSFVNTTFKHHLGWRTKLKITLFSKKLRHQSNNQITIYGGIVQIFGTFTQHAEDACSESIFEGLSFVGRYENGRPIGVCWRQLIGGSWLYGLVDKDGRFSGENIAYIYPDLEFALIGSFSNGIMVQSWAG